ncbi:MAG: DinB family protein [Candidatus Rokubacteria bacterium]|nr:DinB family protein [Candidatus Rokubacteria bacterium]
MAVDRSYIADNNAQRARLRALVDRLSDQDLARPLSAGWTVAGVLAHLAFWDQRVLVLLEHWGRSGPGATPPRMHPDDVDWINDAGKALCLALPPGAAARLAVTTADAVDQKVAALSDDLVTANAAAGNPINLGRAQHRREHLDEIERALRG